MIQRLTGFALLMSLAFAGAGQIALALGTPALGQTPASSASVEGTVVRVGTNEPISGVDVELPALMKATPMPRPQRFLPQERPKSLRESFRHSPPL
jgi:hypothetical protein